MEQIEAGQRQKWGKTEREESQGETVTLGRLNSSLWECADVFQNAHYNAWPIHYPDNTYYLLTYKLGTRTLFITTILWMKLWQAANKIYINKCHPLCHDTHMHT